MIFSVNQSSYIDQLAPNLSLLAFEKIGQLCHIQHLETPINKFSEDYAFVLENIAIVVILLFCCVFELYLFLAFDFIMT